MRGLTNYLFIFVLIFKLDLIESANILGIFGLPVQSHQSFFGLIWKELALRGHNVTVVATNPLNDPTIKNLTEIDWSFAFAFMEKRRVIQKTQKETGMRKIWKNLLNATMTLTEMELAVPDFQALVKNKDNHFDVVLVEFSQPVFFYLSEIFNCPLILMTSMPATSFTLDVLGNPVHPYVSVDTNLPFGKKLSFTQRLISAGYYFWMSSKVRSVYFPLNEQLGKKYFGIDEPLQQFQERKVSLAIANVVPGITNIHAKVPNLIEINGLHLKPPAPLQKDLTAFLDSATEGAIYFSLGTLVVSDEEEDQLEIFAQVFAELPYKVLWKIGEDNIKTKSKNVLIRSYFESQQDILRHPNVRVFITQGGLHSLEEAIAYQVPIVGVPFVGDQISNIKNMVDEGMGVEIDFMKATKDDIKGAIREVMTNPRYMEKVKEVSKYAFDKPIKPMDEVIYWIEYVIRHDGAYHLRSPYLDLSWVEYYLVDAIGTILVVLLLLIYISYKILKLVLSILLKLIRPKKVKSD